MLELAGRIAVVTGGATGMGRGIASRLKGVGMTVVIADIDEARVRATADLLQIDGFVTNVADPNQVETLAANVLKRHGAVHVVCNNAGVGPVGKIADMTLKDWRFVLDVNLWGVIHGVSTFLPLLKRNADGGHIINTSSMAGLMAGPLFAAYAVSKYGVVALTEVLAQELAIEGSSVRASVLLPGPTKTDISSSLRNRPAGEASGLADMDIATSDLFPGGIPWKTPEDVGNIVIEGLRTGDLYLFTHPELSAPIFDRFDTIRTSSQSALDRARS